MARVGGDPGVSAQDALRQVARLAAPRGSRVEVAPSDDQFVVKVAFPLSRMSPEETGAVTKHSTPASLRREVEEISARVVRDLFEFCGSRGIAKLQVSCNRAVRLAHIPEAATEAERQELLRRGRLVMSRIYRVSVDQRRAAPVDDWRRVSLPQVMNLMQIEYDGLKTLTIDASLFGNYVAGDPEGELEF